MMLFVGRTLYLFIDWLSISLKRGDWGRASIPNSFWLDTDEVIVPWCFATASLQSDFEPKSLSFHHGRLQEGHVHFGAGHCKYFIDFLTIVLPWKSVRLIPGPLSQVVSNFPHSTLLRSPSFITGGTWDLRTLSQVSRFFPRNFPSQRAFHLRPFFSFPSRSSDWLLTLLVTFYGCYRWPRWKPKKSRSSP